MSTTNTMKKITVNFDGAAWLWKKCSYGFLVKEGNLWLYSDYGLVPTPPDKSTSNVAEHYAVNKALEWLVLNGHKDDEITLVGDSKLVISQLFRGWKINDESLPYVPFCRKNWELLNDFTNIKGKLIPRKYNADADDLSKLGLEVK